MTEHQTVENHIFTDFIGFALNHIDGIFRAAHSDEHIAFFALFHRGVDYKFAVDTADANRADGPQKGNKGKMQRRGNTVDAQNIGSVILFHGKNRDHSLHIVFVAFGEQRSQRTVRNTGGKNGFFRGTPFSFDKSAGDTADSV